VFHTSRTPLCIFLKKIRCIFWTSFCNLYFSGQVLEINRCIPTHREKTWSLGFGLPSTTLKCVNWSSHLTTNHPFGPSREQVKWKILFFCKTENHSCNSCWNWEDAESYQIWGQDSNFSFWKPQTLAHSLWNWSNLVRGSSLMWGFSWKYPIYHMFLFTLQLSHLIIFELVMGIWMLVKPLNPLLTAWKPRQKPACPNTNTQL
jgi:hypothetical protein